MPLIISKNTMQALLGRSLTTEEDTNYSTYLDLATLRIKDILCLEELPDPLEIDLQLLIARCFDLIGQEQFYAQNNYQEVESKKVEDFTLTYANNYYKQDEMPMSKFVKINLATILKYSKCQSSKVLHGELCYGDCIRYI